jgi:hypothetical protein
MPIARGSYRCEVITEEAETHLLYNVQTGVHTVEGNAKCHELKIFTCKGTFRQVFICLRPRNPQGREGRVEPGRKGLGQQGRVQVTQLG